MEAAIFSSLTRENTTDRADGLWLQDEDTLDEGFLALEDESVSWMMDENEAFVARRFKRGKMRKTKKASRLPGKSKRRQAQTKRPL